MEEDKNSSPSMMAVDDVALCETKQEASSDGCELRSVRSSADTESSANSSRASSLLTDITECSSSTSSSNSSTARLPSQFTQQQHTQPPPPLRGKHNLYKSTSSFHLSSGYGCRSHGHGALSNGAQACCQLARFPPHLFHHSSANYNPLATSRHLRQMQTQQQHHTCAQAPSSYKMGPIQYSGMTGQIGSGQQVAPAPSATQQLHQQQTQGQAVVHSQQHLRHQSSVTSFALSCQSQFSPPLRSASSGTVGFGGCNCCCHCDSRFFGRQSLISNNFKGSYEGLMGSPSHTVDAMPPPESGPPPLTAEGLSWRRLHMSRAKLKATATTSELLSGFAMVAMVELQINEPTNVPEWLFVLFAVCTTVLVSVHIFALMISTYILPNVDAVSKMQHNGQGGSEGGNAQMSHNRHPSYSSSTTFSSSGVDPAVLESPHERMRGFIELAWAFSTVLGLFLFLVELAILCWVKFWDYSFTAAWAATAIVIPVLVFFLAFAAHFYHSLVAIKCDTSASDMRDLEKMKADLDAAARDATAASNV